jgi:hypothetical protein
MLKFVLAVLNLDGIADQVPKQNLKRWLVLASLFVGCTNVAHQQVRTLGGFGEGLGL